MCTCGALKHMLCLWGIRGRSRRLCLSSCSGVHSTGVYARGRARRGAVHVAWASAGSGSREPSVAQAAASAPAQKVMMASFRFLSQGTAVARARYAGAQSGDGLRTRDDDGKAGQQAKHAGARSTCVRLAMVCILSSM